MKRLIFSTIGMIICAFLIYSSAQTLDVYYKNEKAYEDAKINGLNIEQNKKGMYGFVNTKGKFIIKPIFDEVKNFKNDLAQVKYKGKWGFIDLHGKTIIEPIFDEVNEFLNNLSLVKYNNKWGIVNSNGEMVINAEYTNTPQHIQYNNTSDVSQCLLFKNENKHIAVIFCTQNKDNIIINLKEYIHQNGCYLFITQLLENEKFKYGTTYVINNKGKLSKFDAFNIITHKHLTQAPNLIISQKDDKLSIMNINSGKTFDLPAKYTDFIIKESGIMFLGGSSQPNNFNSQYIYHAYGYYDKSKDDFVLINSLKPIVESCNNKITYIKYHKQGLSNYLILNNSTNNVIYDNAKAVTEYFINNDTIIEITLDDNIQTLIKTNGDIIIPEGHPFVIKSNSIIIPNIEIDNIYYNLDISNKVAEISHLYTEDYSKIYHTINIPSQITYSEIEYTVTSIGYEAFNSYKPFLFSITIPNSVTSIGERAFYECDRLVSITIPNSVTSIGDDAFVGCYSLPSISIPNSVTSIGKGAFGACEALTSITIPDGVSSIEDSTFIYCGKLSSITIPNSVTSIGEGAFCSCYRLSSIEIPNSVTSIGEEAFSYCSSLTSITIPNSVTSIGEEVFSFCDNLTAINTDKDNPNYTSINGVLYNKNITTLIACPAGKTKVTIPNSVTSIGENAFYGCENLTSITIPNSVTSIEDDAFAHCTSLKSITIPNSVTSIGERAFYECNRLVSITIPNSITYIGRAPFERTIFWDSIHNANTPDGCIYIGKDLYYYKENKETEKNAHIKIKEGTTQIFSHALSNEKSIVSISIPASVTLIEEWNFYNCPSLTAINVDKNNPNYTSIDGVLYNKDTTTLIAWPGAKTDISIPNSVTSIGKGAFRQCASLTSINIPSNITSIDKSAFFWCENLTSITIPNSVTSIGEDAFWNCDNLTSVYISDIDAWCNIDFKEYDSNPLSYAKNLYLNKEKVTNLIIPRSVNSIKDYAFSNFSSLASVTISNNVISIGEEAFKNCSSLSAIIIPNSVTSIRKGAFSGCSSLSSITIPNSITEIEKFVFNDCKSLSSVKWDAKKCNDFSSDSDAPFYDIRKQIISFTLGENVKHIPAHICNDMNITSITIPNSVTSIGNGAFENCNNLTSITIPNSVTYIGNNTFKECSNLTSITISNNLTSIRNRTFADCSSLTSLTIPNSVTSIDKSAFEHCSSLKSITIPDNVTSIGSWAFAGCSSLSSIKIGTCVTSIGHRTFENCSSLTSITIPNNVTSIGEMAFYDCKSLTSIYVNKNNQHYISIDGVLYNKDTTILIACPETKTDISIPNSVTSIGNWAFAKCSSLTSITIPDNVTSIGNWTFANCSSLTSITIPQSVTSIGDDTFAGCSSLTSITIPDSVTSIGEEAFFGCINLTSITIPNSVTSIGDNAFEACYSLKSIYVNKNNQHYISVDGALYTKDMKNLIYKP